MSEAAFPARSGRAWPLALAVLVVMVSLGFHSAARPPVTGDETHYLIYGNSLARGWGVDLERAYVPDNRSVFYRGELDLHAQRYREGGPLATWHGIGLPALLAPVLVVRASAWLGRLLMIGFTGLLAYQLCRLCTALTRARPTHAALACAAVLLSAPVLWYSGLIFPEIPLALCLVGSLRAFVEGHASWVRLGLASTLAATAPWFAYRILPVSVVLLLAYLGVAIRDAGDRRTAALARALAMVVVPAAVLGGGLALLAWYLYGAPTPSAAIDRLPQGQFVSGLNFRPANLYYYGVGGLIGFPSGILPHGPALLVAVTGMALAAVRLGWRRLLVVLVATGAYVAYAAYFGSAGYGPPGRYFVPVVPLLAVPLAVVVADETRWFVAIVGAVTAVSVVFAVSPAGEFLRLYRSTVDDLPVAATARLWPFIDAIPPSTSFDAPAGTMSHATGTVEASGAGIAVMGREGRDAPGFLTYGPFAIFAPGEYVAHFTLVGGEMGDRSGVLALDVSAFDEPLPLLAQQRVLIDPGQVLTVSLPFGIGREAALQFRVHYEGTGAVGAASIAVRASGHPPRVRDVRREAWKAAVWLAGLLLASSLWAAVRAEGGRLKQLLGKS